MKHWQKEHERLLMEMAKLVGVEFPSQIHAAISHMNPDKWQEIEPEYRRLNRLNSEACEKAQKQS